MTSKLTDQLTDRQAKILEYIRFVTKVRNYPPSVREIGEAVGLSSSSTVHNHLNQLERRGLIRRDPSKSRTVQLVQDEELDKQRRNAVAVPVIGNVAAGAPILAEQNIEDHVLLSPEMAQDGFFLLRVRGESMINAGIFDGTWSWSAPAGGRERLHRGGHGRRRRHRQALRARQRPRQADRREPGLRADCHQQRQSGRRRARRDPYVPVVTL
jgi:hypothetical protein